MEAMAVDAPSSPAPASTAATLPEPPYHHSPSPAEAVTPPPKVRSRSPLPSPLQVSGGCSLQELLLLSSPPPLSSRRHRSRTRGAGVDESLEMVAGTPTPPRRRRRGAGEPCAAPALASPRNGRRARRRLEKEVEVEEDAATRKARRRKSTRVAASKAAQVVADKAAVAAAAKKGEDMSLALVPARPDATRSAGTDLVEQSGWEGLWERIVELVMWRNVAKSALWFGFGSMFFFSCSCSREITFRHVNSDISVYFLLLMLCMGFCCDLFVIFDRPQVEKGRSFQLTEDDVLRASRAVLPVANSMISTAQVIFSGEPLMTLKVLPVLLFGAKYGSLVTVWRLLAAAFISLVVLRYNQKYRKGDINMGVEGCQEGQDQNMETDD
ncbi:hypothetical protein PR202_gb06955 [Eleusine coracana subsp. coracana]|uniref:Reticulon domain-containing protein n=1 Tax=Eleusine coracana subsp. coracana TaxID=191504 RepID=A0AAV5EAZ9_ELECO|nr:hypothetical protein PR202_gb06955 [Eleusine coracana subsp. coracana]